MIRTVVALLAIMTAGVLLQSPARAQAQQAIYLIDKPTAGILGHGSYLLRGRMGPESSFLLGARVGVRDILQGGFSVGMQSVFERGDIDVNEHIGLKARVRLIQEGALPALAVGIDTQGIGKYHKDLKRYDRKSPGFYGVVSRNYALSAGDLALHGGANWSLETEDQSAINIFGGIELTFGQQLSFILDADAALNDNEENGMFGQGGYYLDGAVRLYAGESIILTLVFRDLAANLYSRVGREFEVTLIEFF
jgi:hypothetical protein